MYNLNCSAHTTPGNVISQTDLDIPVGCLRKSIRQSLKLLAVCALCFCTLSTNFGIIPLSISFDFYICSIN